jgi:hypothetical protein
VQEIGLVNVPGGCSNWQRRHRKAVDCGVGLFGYSGLDNGDT